MPLQRLCICNILDNGMDQDPKTGRFVSGNKAGNRAYNRNKERNYRAFNQAIKTKDIKEVIAKLLQLAKSGNIKAIQYYLDRCLGKPDSTHHIDTSEIPAFDINNLIEESERN